MAVLISWMVLVMTAGVALGRSVPEKLDFDYPDYQPPQFSKSILANYKHQSVAADARECSQLGNEILLKNGSAVEAAITTALCAGLYHPHSCGLGGGHFMVTYQKSTQRATAIIAREMAPLAATELMYVNPVNKDIDSVKGWHAVAVPGEIAGYRAAFDRFKSGNLQWKDLFAPIIKLARNGVRVDSVLAGQIKKHADDILNYDDTLRTLFTKNRSTLMVEGDVYRNPALARTLEIIANDPTGTREFYHGEVAKNLIADIHSGGGIITMEDLAHYKADVQPAIQTTLADKSKVHGVPPPAGGLIVQHILAIMDGYDYGNNTKSWKDMNDQEKILFYQRFAEAMKFAYARRAEMGDKTYEPQVAEMEKVLLTHWFASMTRSQINDERTSNDTRYYGIKTAQKLQKHGTSHISIIDRFGNAAAITTTINTIFGSNRVSKSTGIILNNQMDDFTANPNEPNFYGLPPSTTNRIVPGKRPQSSCSPTIITDSQGQVKIVIGGSGGSRIISSVSSALLRVLYMNQTVKEAIDAPRIHHQLLPMRLEYEQNFDDTHLDGLVKFGHELSVTTSISVVQGLVRSVNGSIYANCDYRKRGAPAGL